MYIGLSKMLCLRRARTSPTSDYTFMFQLLRLSQFNHYSLLKMSEFGSFQRTKISIHSLGNWSMETGVEKCGVEQFLFWLHVYNCENFAQHYSRVMELGRLHLHLHGRESESDDALYPQSDVYIPCLPMFLQ